MFRPRIARTLCAVLGVALLVHGCRGKNAVGGAFKDAPIILISIDTLRADHLPLYGYKGVETPALARLAGDGIVYDNAYAHVPLTLPSHTTMLTGRLPYENGVRSNIGYSLRGTGPTLPQLLKARGYATGGAISSYVLRGETGIGPLFDFYDDSLEIFEAATLGALQRDGNDTVRTALRWVDTVREKPFFLFLHLFEPHTPYEPAPELRARYAASPYDGEIATVDAILGRFIAELEQRGLYDDAMIVVTADHGEGLNDHGEAEHGVLLYRESLHVPLIVKLPGKRLAGKRVAAPAQLVDLLPTLAAAAGAQVPDGLPGASLIELAEGKVAADRAVYSETLYPRLHLGWSELRSLTDAKHHYIEAPSPELFDVVTDPRETKNLRDDRRREAFALAGALKPVPLNLVAPGSGDPEERARLAALGYLSGAATTTGPPRNPRDHIKVLARVQETFKLNQEGRYAESVRLCREILREYPELVDVYSQLAGNLRRLGLLDEALQAYKEAVRLSPQLIDSVAIEIAKLELDLGHLKEAELNAQQAMKLNPAESHLLMAGVASARKDWAAAEREARLAVGREDRPRIPALVVLAKVLVEQGRLPEALATVDRANSRIAQDGAPPVATLASTRGDILARMGRVQEAEAAFRQEIRSFPTTTDAYTRLAILLASQHRFAEIEPTLEAMVKASPRPMTYGLAAQAMADLGNTERARFFQQRGERLAAELRQRKPPAG